MASGGAQPTARDAYMFISSSETIAGIASHLSDVVPHFAIDSEGAIDPAANAFPAILAAEDAASPVESGAAPQGSGAKWTRVSSESCALRGGRG